ncbi:MAG TPA: mannitol dehydrogenase family protein [Hyphomonas sp.]|nr:mannitol dehydrogenase family protein [Hyphomonas sp.]
MSRAPRLSSATLTQLPPQIMRPGYDRAAQKTGCVHFGVGAFHRAHQASYFDALMNAGKSDWQVLGVSMRSPAVGDQLNPQDGLFTVNVRDGAQNRLQVVGSIREVVLAGKDSRRIIDALASSDVSLATITVTEKGYCLDPATGALGLANAAIARDMENGMTPSSLPGLLCAGLAERRAANVGPLTILSCDNLSNNGVAARQAVVGFAAETNEDLARWIERECAFPSSMVDRIVPATTQADIDALELKIGLRDEATVSTEPFSQWVVEDRFAARRPPLDMAGVQFTSDVAGWEHAKLRLLNAAHSSMAYLGALAGFDFIHEAIAFPPLKAHVEALWDEQEATLRPTPGLNVREYRVRLLERFSNPALHHRTRQIAMDGSQKLPPRLVAPLRERRRSGLTCPNQCLAIAAWMRWQLGQDETGRAYTVDDPLANETRRRLRDTHSDPQAMVHALLGVESVFPPVLASDDNVVGELTRSLGSLLNLGARETLSRRF